MDNIWATNGGVYFGYESDALEGRPPSLKKELRYTGDRMLISTGSNGSGKTRLMLLPNVVNLVDWSMLIVDPKGDICAMTAAHRRAHGNEVIILNPFNVLNLGSRGYNPLGSMTMNEDFPDDAMGQAEAKIRIEGNEPHWPQGAQDLDAALIMYVRLMIEGGSYSDVRALLGLDDKGLQALVGSEHFEYKGKEYLGMLHAGVEHDWEEIGIKAGRFADINPENREMHGIISEALTQTRWLDSRPIKRDLAGPTFDFAVMKERPVTVYLILPPQRLITHSTWLRLMITSILQSVMRDTRRAKTPILIALDEAAALGHLPVIENNMAMMRGYGIKLWTIWQDLPQIQAIYDKRWESFFGNAGVVQSFAPQDLTTSKYLSEMSGQTTKFVSAHGDSLSTQPGAPSGASITSNVNVSPMGTPLLLPHQVRNMDPGFSLLLASAAKGPIRSFAPYPTQLPHMRDIMKLDPSG